MAKYGHSTKIYDQELGGISPKSPLMSINATNNTSMNQHTISGGFADAVNLRNQHTTSNAKPLSNKSNVPQMYPQNTRRRATYHGHDPSAFTSSNYGDSRHELNVNDFGDRAVADGEMVTAAPVSRFHNLRTEPSGSSSPPKNA